MVCLRVSTSHAMVAACRPRFASAQIGEGPHFERRRDAWSVRNLPTKPEKSAVVGSNRSLSRTLHQHIHQTRSVKHGRLAVDSGLIRFVTLGNVGAQHLFPNPAGRRVQPTRRALVDGYPGLAGRPRALLMGCLAAEGCADQWEECVIALAA